MWRNIFLFLLTVGNIQDRSTSIPVDCATRVQKCPVEKHQWAKKTREFECAAGDGYVCMRDADGYLYEGCMINFTIQANSGNCPIMYACRRNKPYLGPDTEYYRCPEEVPGCPPKHHAEYDIHQLFKYPKCIESSFYSVIENSSPRSTTSISKVTISTGDNIDLGEKHVVIGIVMFSLLLIVVGCFICYALYSGKKHNDYHIVTSGENKGSLKEDHEDLRCWIRSINESEADRIRILSLKENDTIELDRIYVPLSITDEYQIHTTERQMISDITPDKMFYKAQGKPARFVFILGDAGYGKTVQCRRIAKLWCKAWKAENGQGNEDYGDLRRWIQSINESEADRIRILPLKEYDTIEVDRIYVPLSIVDEFEMHTSGTTDKKTISELTPDKMYISPGKPARFIYMLGDAGYGKTVQCRRIAKLWCKAWKAENAQTEIGKVDEWEKRLKDFEFLFYVPMRDINNEHVSLKDMIYDYYRRFNILQEHLEHLGHLDTILNVLTDKRYKCLIILDGLDEWNMSESKRKDLQNKGLPNSEDMLNCTFLITMRSWKFMEVDPICRQGFFTKVLLLHGLDANGIEELTSNILCNYFKIKRHSKKFLEQSENLKKKASLLSRELESLMKIPLLAVFFILTWHEKIETGHSLTTFYLSMIEALIKRSQIQQEIKFTSELSTSLTLKNFPYVSSCIPEILRLCKLAFEDLDSRGTTIVLTDVHLKGPKVKDTADLFLRIGLLIKHDAKGQIHEDNVRFSFLHKTIQEFIYTLYLVYDRSEAEIVNFVKEKISDIEKTLELATVLTFISGLSPEVGCKVSSHIAKLASKDKEISRYRDYFASETYYKVFHLFNLQLSCYREVRGGKSIEDFQTNETKFILSDIFLHGNDTDKLTIRETADVLCYHAKDIISLYMKLIPDDNEKGITNFELETFLHKSASLLALNIDGYNRGDCRLLDNFSPISPHLHTLGLHNVAFTDNILVEFLTKDESKRKIKALGLFYIKSAEDLVVEYQYQFLSVYRFSSAMSGYVMMCKMCSVSEKATLLKKDKGQPLLNVVLKVLPEYPHLVTLHVSYMDSAEDRKLLLQVVPEIKTLEHFGYHGSLIYETPDYVYDTEVIQCLLKIKRLQKILLSLINLQEDILTFTNTSQLRQIRLQQFEMKQSNWMTFAKSVSTITTLSKIVLYDTNIDEEILEMLEKLSPKIIKDDSKEWCV